MSPEIIDTHAHLDMSQFDYDRKEMIQRAYGAGVKTIITVGTDLASSRKAVELSGKCPGIFAAIGVHPQEANKINPGDIKEFTAMAKNTQVAAIGEIGLDYYRMTAAREIQLKVLQLQLDLAANLNLPVIIHARQAEDDMVSILTKWTAALPPEIKQEPGVIHCFNGEAATAEKYLNLGFYIAFGAYTGYPSSRLAEAIRSVPDDRILVETDCPFLPPQTHRGKRNEPAYLPNLGVIARSRTESFETIAKKTTENAKRLFRI